ncbi:MAG: 4-hydroxy-3-methylbut-2-enyl diphosphate reductase [Candidatus Omnitrophica bacterium]|nr:4-hydroxy-3-methylbut-2-enyl diphosphate reductase [Candidatus Omnitrophota bacterium]
MKVNIAKTTGFCFGVKRAIDTALQTSKEHKNVYMLGDIVHNETVTNKVMAEGIKKISKLSKNNGDILLIRAHGAPIKTLRDAKKFGYKIVDATCPMVKEIHKVAQKDESAGYTVIIIGDKKHDEVIGIKGNLKNSPFVIDPSKKFPAKKVESLNKISIVVQSTQNIEEVLNVVKKISSKVKNVKFNNTICNPTTQRQKAAKDIPSKNDIVIVIGSKTSANTKRLFEISNEINPKTYWIQKDTDIKKAWFKNAGTIGILAGASTPEETIQRTAEKIKGF